MDPNTSQPAGGTDRNNPQRGMGGYAPRQTEYYSAGRPATPVNPTIAMASEAAQRIVSPEPVAPVAPNPVTPQVGSFDMLPPKPVETVSPTQNTSTTPAFRSDPVAMTPALPAQFPSQFASPAALPNPSLPTDLPALNLNEEDDKALKKHGKLKLSLPKVAVVVIVPLFVAGGVFTYLGFTKKTNAPAQVKSAQTTAKQDNDGGIWEGDPKEKGNAPSVDHYRTAATYPRVLRAPVLSVEARVLALYIAPTGALKSPGNIFDVGWYRDSARPGEVGAMVIDGYESGPTRTGVFSKIGSLKKDDKLEIETGDGRKFTYTVKAVKMFEADKLDMSSVMKPFVPETAGLNLITAGGKFNEQTQKYPPRTVVYAVID